MRLNLLIFLLGIYSFSFSQPYGNEWINYSQNYYSFKIAEDGIYRIDHTVLQNAGIPLGSITSSQFQLFTREKEVELFVSDGGDGTIDPGDFIEFYARKNDGWLDSLVYDSPSNILNPYYSLYNDTIHYFLTWKTSGNGLRVVEETDVNFSGFAIQNYFMKYIRTEFTGTYVEGEKVSGLSSSYFSAAEGWALYPSNAVPTNVSRNVILPTTNIYTAVGAPDAVGLAVSCGVSNASYTGSGNHHLSITYGSLVPLFDTVYSGYQLIKHPFQIAASTLVNGSTNFVHTYINDQGAASDYQSIAYVDLTYPATTDFSGLTSYDFLAPFNTLESKSRYDITNHTISIPIVYAFGDQTHRINAQVNGGILQFLVPNNSSGEQLVVVADQTEIKSVPVLEPINGNGSFTNYSLISSDNFLIISESSLSSSVAQYEAYRESAQGGGYNVYTAYTNELYLQFGGGIEKHALGIRRFVNYFVNNSTTNPEFMFLIGKGIREANESNTLLGVGSRNDSASYQSNLVPSWGYPSSDVLLTAGLDGNLWVPLLSTGRLSASTDQEVLDYLSKMQEFESAQDPSSIYSTSTKDWQKQILHFGGGSTDYEQQLFKAYLQGFEAKIEGLKFGGNVYSTYKTVSEPIDPVTSQDVTNRINSGASIMTFFGHASASGFDQNVDDPSNWYNQGKYPLVIGNACYTGNIFNPVSNSTSERFVMIPNKGAIAFLSSVKLGFSNTLNTYTSELYQQISTDAYGAALGTQIRNTIQAVESPSGGLYLESTCLGMTLHGDPALKVNWHQNPEFEITNQSLIVEPENINLSVDTITVKLVLTNLGRATDSSFTVELRRTFPGATVDSVYSLVSNGLYYKDTVEFKMPLDPNNGPGLNVFSAKVDIPSQITEQYDEVFNNEISVPYFISIEGIYPVWPFEYAVVPYDTVTLKASTNNPFVSDRLYRFEIDTTDLFNSPFRKYKEVMSPGGVVEVAPNEWLNANTDLPEMLVLSDSTVCFWRVAIDSSVLLWNESSFQYIPGKQGWGQEHFFQFKNNDFVNLNYDRILRKRSFFPDKKIINCQVYGNSTDFNELLATDWKIDGEVQEYGLCGLTPSLIVAVVDPITLEAWGTANGGQNPTHSFGNVNDGASCRNRVEKYFIFRQNSSAQLAAFENMVLNEIPDSFYVLIYTTTYADFAQWDALYPSTYNVFQSLGSTNIATGNPNVPFIFFTKKGDNSKTHEEIGVSIDSDLILNDTLDGYDYLGEEKSTMIGPAFNWSALYWKQNPEESPTSDSTRLQVYGTNTLGVETLLIDTLFSTLDSIANLNLMIPAATFPWIRLKAIIKDSIDFTPAQIDGWHVLYEPVPEAAIEGELGYYWSASDTIPEGMDVSFAGQILNVSDYPMDSLLVKYWIEDQYRNIHPIPYLRQDSLRVGGDLLDTITFNTTGLSGRNLLWMEVNPYVTPILQDQLEMHYFNNLAQIPFYVAPDEINPVLDVTFDGTHILNGDIVSGKAQIVISLNDENEFLLLDEDADTANFGIYLKDPLGNQVRIPFIGPIGETVMQWIPASGPENKFKIIYDGNFALDGIYELLVQGSDVSGNNSGDLEYRIEFEVINQSSVTYLMNYPNPFSTSTRFVFTLTGNQIPDEMRIQILTVTGKVVKTITMDEFGPIKVGKNISEYAWDGRDDWGDQLANGVYLYTVQMRINGETIDHRGSGADEFFKKEFGKMYLLR
ncbi:MAG: C25 family cysteine peptidase [Crocinitomicaceae bacterium]